MRSYEIYRVTRCFNVAARHGNGSVIRRIRVNPSRSEFSNISSEKMGRQDPNRSKKDLKIEKSEKIRKEKHPKSIRSRSCFRNIRWRSALIPWSAKAPNSSGRHYYYRHFSGRYLGAGTTAGAESQGSQGSQGHGKKGGNGQNFSLFELNLIQFSSIIKKNWDEFRRIQSIRIYSMYPLYSYIMFILL